MTYYVVIYNREVKDKQPKKQENYEKKFNVTLSRKVWIKVEQYLLGRLLERRCTNLIKYNKEK